MTRYTLADFRPLIRSIDKRDNFGRSIHRARIAYSLLTKPPLTLRRETRGTSSAKARRW